MVCFVPVKTEALLDILGTSFGVRVVRKDDGVPHRILAHQVAKFAELCHLPRYIACQERFLRTTFKRLPIFWNISF